MRFTVEIESDEPAEDVPQPGEKIRWDVHGGVGHRHGIVAEPHEHVWMTDEKGVVCVSCGDRHPEERLPEATQGETMLGPVGPETGDVLFESRDGSRVRVATRDETEARVTWLAPREEHR